MWGMISLTKTHDSRFFLSDFAAVPRLDLGAQGTQDAAEEGGPWSRSQVMDELDYTYMIYVYICVCRYNQLTLYEYVRLFGLTAVRKNDMA